jgi:aflatoxin B1 aldehyde reductase
MSQGLEIIFGAGGIGSPHVNTSNTEFSTLKGTRTALKIIRDSGIINSIDTATVYGESEAFLGELKAGTDLGFTLDTKWAGAWGGRPSLTGDEAVTGARASLKRLQVDQVDVFYTHAPDHTAPLEDQLRGINQAYLEGAFRRFGLSNYSPEEVQETYDVCKRNGFVLPTVYQGLYSPVNRTLEKNLLPLLRKLGISFRGFSPLSGGFLTKTVSQIQNGEGRFKKDFLFGMYDKQYNKPEFLQALQEWCKIAEEEGVSGAELALRWVSHHSALKKELGDGIIIGANGSKQLQKTCDILKKGPLSENAAKGIDGLWETVQSVAWSSNLEGLKDMKVEL